MTDNVTAQSTINMEDFFKTVNFTQLVPVFVLSASGAQLYCMLNVCVCIGGAGEKPH